MADVTTAGPGLAGRERVRADQAGYRTFPARLPAVLCAIAGVLGLLGALGAGVRASAVENARDEPLQVGVLMGSDSGVGWLLAVLAVLVGVSAIAWLSRRRALKLGAAATAMAFVALSAVRLASFDGTAAEWAQAALRAPDFVGYHAGFGWGSWMLVTAALSAAFAVLVAALRALDLRKGIAG
ncbi:MAG TPA: hypothetical protein VJ922_01210 [Actinomycetota bacterium]|nr:hypothetical protein [Actinomycetota bacterium]